jgi:hypothetical protein
MFTGTRRFVRRRRDGLPARLGLIPNRGADRPAPGRNQSLKVSPPSSRVKDRLSTTIATWTHRDGDAKKVMPKYIFLLLIEKFLI